MSTHAHAKVRFADPEVQKCPFASYQQLREDERSVYLDPDTGHYHVLDYDLVRSLAGDAETLSNRCGLLIEVEGPQKALSDQVLPYPLLDVLVSGDDPDHKVHRALVAKFFTPPRVAKMESYIEALVNEYIEAFIDRGEVELHSALSQKIPIAVIADMLGVPRSDMDRFLVWSKAAVDRANTELDEASLLHALELYGEFQLYIAEKMKEVRASPGESILSELVHGDVDGRTLTEVEIISIAVNLLIAGNETTTNAMSNAMVRLAKDPVLQQELRTHPERIPAFIEEVLRADSPIQGLFRRATTDLQIGGVDIPAGAILMLRFGAANRDPRKFEDPDQFRLDRPNGRQHIAFGYGPHFCVGSPLARAEAMRMLETVLRRMQNIRLADRPDALTYNPYYIVYGVKELHLTFDKTA